MKILLATDGSAGADVALEFLAGMPLPPIDDVLVVSASPYGFAGRLAPLERARATAEQAALRLRACGLRAEPLTRVGEPVDVIHREAVAQRVDLIVVGSRGLGAITGAIFSSTARALARLTPLPLLVVRGLPEPPRRLLAFVDGSVDGHAARTLLAMLPLAPDATVALVTEERTASANGHLAQEILKRAETDRAELIVLGLRGGVSDQVLSQAHCAVLVARQRPAWLAEVG